MIWIPVLIGAGAVALYEVITHRAAVASGVKPTPAATPPAPAPAAQQAAVIVQNQDQNSLPSGPIPAGTLDPVAAPVDQDQDQDHN